MKRKFRIIIGMLLLAIPLCLNAQVKPIKENQKSNVGAKPKKEKVEAGKTEKPINPAKPGNNAKPTKPTKPESTANPAKPTKPGDKEKPENPKGGLEMPKVTGFVQGLYQANLNDHGEF